MTTTYTYSIINDFNGYVNTGRFHQIIIASAAIGSYVMHIDRFDDAIYILFSQELSPSELSILNGLIAAYTPQVESATEVPLFLTDSRATPTYVTSSTYTIVCNFIVPANSFPSITAAYVNIACSTSLTKASIKIYDSTNSILIAELTDQSTTPNVKTLLSLPILAQPSLLANVLEIQVKRDSGLGTVGFNGCTIQS